MKIRGRWLLVSVPLPVLLVGVGSISWIPRTPLVLEPMRGAEFQPSEKRGFDPASVQAWPGPVSQSEGPDWIFELFTPPTVYFNSETRAFTVTPPLSREETMGHGLELLEVARVLYRFQYAGHAGSPGRYRIEVRDLESGSYFRGSVGDSFPESAVTIEAFSAERTRVQPADQRATAYMRMDLRLVVFDWRLERSVELSNEPRFRDEPVVVVRAHDASRHRLSPGDPLHLDGVRYELIAADVESGTAHFSRSATAGQPDDFTLTRVPGSGR